MTRVTITALKAEISEMKQRYDQSREQIRDAEISKARAHEETKEARGQFADLKKRLHNSEMEVARLNGYLARVREDDVVREDLVTVGEPGGEQRMVPKRKPEHLGNREEHHSIHDLMTDGGYGRERKKPKHWIEY